MPAYNLIFSRMSVALAPVATCLLSMCNLHVTTVAITPFSGHDDWQLLSQPITAYDLHVRYNKMVSYTSREDTLILSDESHVSKMLATYVSVGSLTAVTIRRNDTRCQGTVNCKPTVSWFPPLLRTSCFQDPLAWRKFMYVKTWAECRR